MKKERKYYNYLGENMYDMYGGDGYWEACKKKHIGAVETPVHIVYDGKAPREAAKNLYNYIAAMGYEAKLMDADDYRKGHGGSVIVVGHHSLAKEWIEYIGVHYDNYGMRYGFSGNLCVLTASRSALGKGRKGRERFAEHYNTQIVAHCEQAVTYKIPMMFGYRNETRKSQYDLLLLEFIKNGLSRFLKGEETTVAKKQENLVEAMVADLVKKVEADKDMTFTLEDILRNNYKQNESDGIKTLRTHLGENIVFTGLWVDAQEERELEDSELLEGEISAFTFKIGCYMIRSSQRLYQDKDGVHYTERVPATQDMIDEYNTNCKGIDAMFCSYDGLRKCHEISAKYVSGKENVSVDEWRFIGLATDSMSWSESIDFIGTVKENDSTSDEQAELFIQKNYIGSSYSVSNWYRLTPDGKLTGYTEQPYNSESFKISWNE